MDGRTPRGTWPCRAQVSTDRGGREKRASRRLRTDAGWQHFLPVPVLLGPHPRNPCQVQGQEALPGFLLGVVGLGLSYFLYTAPDKGPAPSSARDIQFSQHHLLKGLSFPVSDAGPL